MHIHDQDFRRLYFLFVRRVHHYEISIVKHHNFGIDWSLKVSKRRQLGKFDMAVSNVIKSEALVSCHHDEKPALVNEAHRAYGLRIVVHEDSVDLKVIWSKLCNCRVFRHLSFVHIDSNGLHSIWTSFYGLKLSFNNENMSACIYDLNPKFLWQFKCLCMQDRFLAYMIEDESHIFDWLVLTQINYVHFWIIGLPSH